MVASSNVKVFVACSSALWLKFLAVVTIQGGKTFRAGGRPPEDNKLSLAKGNPKQNYALNHDEKDEKVLKAREVETRWRRMAANDLECIPLALFVFAGGILADANETVFAASMITYTLARYTHSYVYANAMQPHRALAWMLAKVCTLVAAGNAIAGAFF